MKVVRLIVVLSALLLAAEAVPALTMVSEETIRQSAEDYVRAALAGKADPAERMEIHARWQGDVVLEAGGLVRIEMRPLSSHPFRGPAVLRGELLVAGKCQRVLTVTVDTRFYREVLVASRAIRRGEVFAADMVEKAERDITVQKEGFFTEVAALAGKRARRPIASGAIIGQDHGESVPVVGRGGAVRLVLKTRSMEITAQGVAMQDAGVGEPIRVRNLDSGKVVQGQVVDGQTVRIGE